MKHEGDRLGGLKTLKVGGFLDEFEKDDLKKKIDIVTLFENFGISLNKKGRSYTGLCPFHKDRNPSLSVDRKKGLYNCFGCGESGDVFTLVEKIKGYDFKGALAFLKSYAGKTKASSSKAAPVVMPEAEPALKKPVPAVPAVPAKAGPAEPAKTSETQSPGLSPLKLKENNSRQLILKRTADYYHARLLKSKEAMAMLEIRGIKSFEHLKLFNVGHADGSLPEKSGSKQKQDFIACGILRDNGKEHLTGCVTFPLHDITGNTTGFYGRLVKDNGSFKHLYTAGKQEGIFNRNASKVYNHIILTESIIDALSLIILGFNNTQSLSGTNGFTQEHLKILKSDRVKQVILAMDNDDAGRKAADKLTHRLLDENFEVKIIFPEDSAKDIKDWNDFLVAGITKAEIQQLIEEAETLLPAQKESLKVTKQGLKHIFTIKDIIYRILGVKKMFVSSLRVNIRAEYKDLRFMDNVELYSARSRTSFSSSLSRLFNTEEKRIENDLMDITEYLEKERDTALADTPSEAQQELTEQEIKTGMELLKDPDMCKRIVYDLTVLGYVGEDLNKLLIYIAASSRKTDDPISVLILSQSASGKSLLVETVRRLIPCEDVVAISSLSDQALNYMPEQGLVNKFLILGESVHSEVVETQIREMLSNHELSRLVTLKDEKTGQMASKTVTSRVIVSAVLSSTKNEINQENASRYFVINADETKDQTQRIFRSQRRKYTLKRYKEKKHDVPAVIAQHHAAQRLLKNRIIVNPFSGYLNFPDTLMRTRRDNERFIDLIADVCFLFQYQKVEKEDLDEKAGEIVKYIECDMKDYRTAYGILKGILPATISSFPKGAVMLYESFRGLVGKAAGKERLKPEDVKVTQRDIREQTGYSQMFIKRYLRVLVEYEYIRMSSGHQRGFRQSYSLVKDEELYFLDLSMIPTPEEMKKKIEA